MFAGGRRDGQRAHSVARLEAPPEAPMIAGHFGFAAVVKSRERAVPLWALMLAAQWLDVLFIPLFVMGVEHPGPCPARAAVTVA